VQNGAPTADKLESDAIQWQPESCEFACKPPWISTRRSAYATLSNVQNTCVLCERLDGSFLCPLDSFHRGPTASVASVSCEFTQFFKSGS
jgi:hypothetical protein